MPAVVGVFWAPLGGILIDLDEVGVVDEMDVFVLVGDAGDRWTAVGRGC